MSAGVRIELVDATAVADLTAFLSLLAMVGIDPEGEHPIRLSSSVGGLTHMISATIPADELPFATEAEAVSGA